jgi:hypothetical protein
MCESNVELQGENYTIVEGEEFTTVQGGRFTVVQWEKFTTADSEKFTVWHRGQQGASIHTTRCCQPLETIHT